MLSLNKIKDLNVKTLIMFVLLSKQFRGRPTWSVRAAWCPLLQMLWRMMQVTRFCSKQEEINPVIDFLQLSASPWTSEASTRERWPFGAL